MEFSTLMEKLKTGTFNDALPNTQERSGVITPDWLEEVVRKGDDFAKIMTQSISLCLKRFEDKLAARSRVVEQDVITILNSLRQSPVLNPRAEDLVVVRVVFRATLDSNNRLEINTWADMQSCIKPNSDGSVRLDWPVRGNLKANYWPLRYFHDAINLTVN